VVRRINGVSPEDADSSSENRTRFLDLLGVAGGVDTYPDFETGRFVSIVLPFFLLTPACRSPMVKWFPEPVMMCWVWWNYRFK